MKVVSVMRIACAARILGFLFEEHMDDLGILCLENLQPSVNSHGGSSNLGVRNLEPHGKTTPSYGLSTSPNLEHHPQGDASYDASPYVLGMRPRRV